MVNFQIILKAIFNFIAESVDDFDYFIQKFYHHNEYIQF